MSSNLAGSKPVTTRSRGATTTVTPTQISPPPPLGSLGKPIATTVVGENRRRMMEAGSSPSPHLTSHHVPAGAATSRTVGGGGPLPMSSSSYSPSSSVPPPPPLSKQSRVLQQLALQRQSQTRLFRHLCAMKPSLRAELELLYAIGCSRGEKNLQSMAMTRASFAYFLELFGVTTLTPYHVFEKKGVVHLRDKDILEAELEALLDAEAEAASLSGEMGRGDDESEAEDPLSDGDIKVTSEDNGLNNDSATTNHNNNNTNQNDHHLSVSMPFPAATASANPTPRNGATSPLTMGGGGGPSLSSPLATARSTRTVKIVDDGGVSVGNNNNNNDRNERSGKYVNVSRFNSPRGGGQLSYRKGGGGGGGGASYSSRTTANTMTPSGSPRRIIPFSNEENSFQIKLLRIAEDSIDALFDYGLGFPTSIVDNNNVNSNKQSSPHPSLSPPMTPRQRQKKSPNEIVPARDADADARDATDKQQQQPQQQEESLKVDQFVLLCIDIAHRMVAPEDYPPYDAVPLHLDLMQQLFMGPFSVEFKRATMPGKHLNEFSVAPSVKELIQGPVLDTLAHAYASVTNAAMITFTEDDDRSISGGARNIAGGGGGVGSNGLAAVVGASSAVVSASNANDHTHEIDDVLRAEFFIQVFTGDIPMEYEAIIALLQHVGISTALIGGDLLYRLFQRYDTKLYETRATIDFHGFILLLLHVCVIIFGSDKYKKAELATTASRFHKLIRDYFTKQFPVDERLYYISKSQNLTRLVKPMSVIHNLNVHGTPPPALDGLRPAVASKGTQLWVFGNNFPVKNVSHGKKCALYVRFGNPPLDMEAVTSGATGAMMPTTTISGSSGLASSSSPAATSTAAATLMVANQQHRMVDGGLVFARGSCSSTTMGSVAMPHIYPTADTRTDLIVVQTDRKLSELDNEELVESEINPSGGGGGAASSNNTSSVVDPNKYLKKGGKDADVTITGGRRDDYIKHEERYNYAVLLETTTSTPVFISVDRLTWTLRDDVVIDYKDTLLKIRLQKDLVKRFRLIFNAFGLRGPDYEEDGELRIGSQYIGLQQWAMICQHFPMIPVGNTIDGKEEDGHLDTMFSRHPIFFEIAKPRSDYIDLNAPVVDFNEFIKLVFLYFNAYYGVTPRLSEHIAEAFEKAQHVSQEYRKEYYKQKFAFWTPSQGRELTTATATSMQQKIINSDVIIDNSRSDAFLTNVQTASIAGVVEGVLKPPNGATHFGCVNCGCNPEVKDEANPLLEIEWKSSTAAEDEASSGGPPILGKELIYRAQEGFAPPSLLAQQQQQQNAGGLLGKKGSRASYHNRSFKMNRTASSLHRIAATNGNGNGNIGQTLLTSSFAGSAVDNNSIVGAPINTVASQSHHVEFGEDVNEQSLNYSGVHSPHNQPSAAADEKAMSPRVRAAMSNAIKTLQRKRKLNPNNASRKDLLDPDKTPIEGTHLQSYIFKALANIMETMPEDEISDEIDADTYAAMTFEKGMALPQRGRMCFISALLDRFLTMHNEVVAEGEAYFQKSTARAKAAGRFMSAQLFTIQRSMEAISASLNRLETLVSDCQNTSKDERSARVAGEIKNSDTLWAMEQHMFAGIKRSLTYINDLTKPYTDEDLAVEMDSVQALQQSDSFLKTITDQAKALDDALRQRAVEAKDGPMADKVQSRRIGNDLITTMADALGRTVNINNSPFDDETGSKNGGSDTHRSGLLSSGGIHAGTYGGGKNGSGYVGKNGKVDARALELQKRELIEEFQRKTEELKDEMKENFEAEKSNYETKSFLKTREISHALHQLMKFAQDALQIPNDIAMPVFKVLQENGISMRRIVHGKGGGMGSNATSRREEDVTFHGTEIDVGAPVDVGCQANEEELPSLVEMQQWLQLRGIKFASKLSLCGALLRESFLIGKRILNKHATNPVLFDEFSKLLKFEMQFTLNPRHLERIAMPKQSDMFHADATTSTLLTLKEFDEAEKYAGFELKLDSLEKLLEITDDQIKTKKELKAEAAAAAAAASAAQATPSSTTATANKNGGKNGKASTAVGKKTTSTATTNTAAAASTAAATAAAAAAAKDKAEKTAAMNAASSLLASSTLPIGVPRDATSPLNEDIAFAQLQQRMLRRAARMDSELIAKMYSFEGRCKFIQTIVGAYGPSRNLSIQTELSGDVENPKNTKITESSVQTFEDFDFERMRLKGQSHSSSSSSSSRRSSAADTDDGGENGGNNGDSTFLTTEARDDNDDAEKSGKDFKTSKHTKMPGLNTQNLSKISGGKSSSNVTPSMSMSKDRRPTFDNSAKNSPDHSPKDGGSNSNRYGGGGLTGPGAFIGGSRRGTNGNQYGIPSRGGADGGGSRQRRGGEPSSTSGKNTRRSYSSVSSVSMSSLSYSSSSDDEDLHLLSEAERKARELARQKRAEERQKRNDQRQHNAEEKRLQMYAAKKKERKEKEAARLLRLRNNQQRLSDALLEGSPAASSRGAHRSNEKKKRNNTKSDDANGKPPASSSTGATTHLLPDNDPNNTSMMSGVTPSSSHRRRRRHRRGPAGDDAFRASSSSSSSSSHYSFSELDEEALHREIIANATPLITGETESERDERIAAKIAKLREEKKIRRVQREAERKERRRERRARRKALEKEEAARQRELRRLAREKRREAGEENISSTSSSSSSSSSYSDAIDSATRTSRRHEKFNKVYDGTNTRDAMGLFEVIDKRNKKKENKKKNRSHRHRRPHRSDFEASLIDDGGMKRSSSSSSSSFSSDDYSSSSDDDSASVSSARPSDSSSVARGKRIRKEQQRVLRNERKLRREAREERRRAKRDNRHRHRRRGSSSSTSSYSSDFYSSSSESSVYAEEEELLQNDHGEMEVVKVIRKQLKAKKRSNAGGGVTSSSLPSAVRAPKTEMVEVEEDVISIVSEYEEVEELEDDGITSKMVQRRIGEKEVVKKKTVMVERVVPKKMKKVVKTVKVIKKKKVSPPTDVATSDDASPEASTRHQHSQADGSEEEEAVEYEMMELEVETTDDSDKDESKRPRRRHHNKRHISSSGKKKEKRSRNSRRRPPPPPISSSSASSNHDDDSNVSSSDVRTSADEDDFGSFDTEIQNALRAARRQRKEEKKELRKSAKKEEKRSRKAAEREARRQDRERRRQKQQKEMERWEKSERERRRGRTASDDEASFSSSVSSNDDDTEHSSSMYSSGARRHGRSKQSRRAKKEEQRRRDKKKEKKSRSHHSSASHIRSVVSDGSDSSAHDSDYDGKKHHRRSTKASSRHRSDRRSRESDKRQTKRKDDDGNGNDYTLPNTNSTAALLQKHISQYSLNGSVVEDGGGEDDYYSDHTYYSGDRDGPSSARDMSRGEGKGKKNNSTVGRKKSSLLVLHRQSIELDGAINNNNGDQDRGTFRHNKVLRAAADGGGHHQQHMSSSASPSATTLNINVNDGTRDMKCYKYFNEVVIDEKEFTEEVLMSSTVDGGSVSRSGGAGGGGGESASTSQQNQKQFTSVPIRTQTIIRRFTLAGTRLPTFTATSNRPVTYISSTVSPSVKRFLLQGQTNQKVPDIYLLHRQLTEKLKMVDHYSAQILNNAASPDGSTNTAAIMDAQAWFRNANARLGANLGALLGMSGGGDYTDENGGGGGGGDPSSLGSFSAEMAGAKGSQDALRRAVMEARAKAQALMSASSDGGILGSSLFGGGDDGGSFSASTAAKSALKEVSHRKAVSENVPSAAEIYKGLGGLTAEHEIEVRTFGRTPSEVARIKEQIAAARLKREKNLARRGGGDNNGVFIDGEDMYPDEDDEGGENGGDPSPRGSGRTTHRSNYSSRLHSQRAAANNSAYMNRLRALQKKSASTLTAADLTEISQLKRKQQLEEAEYQKSLLMSPRSDSTTSPLLSGGRSGRKGGKNSSDDAAHIEILVSEYESLRANAIASSVVLAERDLVRNHVEAILKRFGTPQMYLKFVMDTNGAGLYEITELLETELRRAHHERTAEALKKAKTLADAGGGDNKVENANIATTKDEMEKASATTKTPPSSEVSAVGGGGGNAVNEKNTTITLGLSAQQLSDLQQDCAMLWVRHFAGRHDDTTAKKKGNDNAKSGSGNSNPSSLSAALANTLNATKEKRLLTDYPTCANALALHLMGDALSLKLSSSSNSDKTKKKKNGASDVPTSSSSSSSSSASIEVVESALLLIDGLLTGVGNGTVDTATLKKLAAQQDEEMDTAATRSKKKNDTNNTKKGKPSKTNNDYDELSRATTEAKKKASIIAATASTPSAKNLPAPAAATTTITSTAPQQLREVNYLINSVFSLLDDRLGDPPLSAAASQTALNVWRQHIISTILDRIRLSAVDAVKDPYGLGSGGGVSSKNATTNIGKDTEDSDSDGDDEISAAKKKLNRQLMLDALPPTPAEQWAGVHKPERDRIDRLCTFPLLTVEQQRHISFFHLRAAGYILNQMASDERRFVSIARALIAAEKKGSINGEKGEEEEEDMDAASEQQHATRSEHAAKKFIIKKLFRPAIRRAMLPSSTSSSHSASSFVLRPLSDDGYKASSSSSSPSNANALSSLPPADWAWRLYSFDVSEYVRLDTWYRSATATATTSANSTSSSSAAAAATVAELSKSAPALRYYNLRDTYIKATEGLFGPLGNLSPLQWLSRAKSCVKLWVKQCEDDEEAFSSAAAAAEIGNSGFGNRTSMTTTTTPPPQMRSDGLADSVARRNMMTSATPMRRANSPPLSANIHNSPSQQLHQNTNTNLSQQTPSNLTRCPVAWLTQQQIFPTAAPSGSMLSGHITNNSHLRSPFSLTAASGGGGGTISSALHQQQRPYLHHLSPLSKSTSTPAVMGSGANAVAVSGNVGSRLNKSAGAATINNITTTTFSASPSPSGGGAPPQMSTFAQMHHRRLLQMTPPPREAPPLSSVTATNNPTHSSPTQLEPIIGTATAAAAAASPPTEKNGNGNNAAMMPPPSENKSANESMKYLLQLFTAAAEADSQTASSSSPSASPPAFSSLNADESHELDLLREKCLAPWATTNVASTLMRRWVVLELRQAASIHRQSFNSNTGQQRGVQTSFSQKITLLLQRILSSSSSSSSSLEGSGGGGGNASVHDAHLMTPMTTNHIVDTVLSLSRTQTKSLVQLLTDTKVRGGAASSGVNYAANSSLPTLRFKS